MSPIEDEKLKSMVVYIDRFLDRMNRDKQKTGIRQRGKLYIRQYDFLDDEIYQLIGYIKSQGFFAAYFFQEHEILIHQIENEYE